ncbi:thiamine biosynthetic bifunctional enzyme Thi4 [Leucosporidium creatinivorum]|uniref:Thiamine biosynthetic bifunctional enzyme Thi4 n=1 Tax=Leucosporidium creatinivorum TaxID=106004 RepID=A0A1Y2DUB2_9BASI|nr:thiamine biosynthetic bifunctional enzyme Thi4 [Leucosporidium creatinivorum]
MAPPPVSYALYYVTGRSLLPSSADPEYYLTHLEQALKGGVTVVQIREKDVDSRVFLEVARKSKILCDKYSIPMLINDRLDIALSVSCGLHVGQSDLPASLARRLLGPDQLLGVSVNTEEELEEVMREGVADYVGIGPCYGTRTKKDLNPLMGTRGVRKILERLGDSHIKAVVIGGITPYTIPNVLRQTPAPLPTGAYRALDGLAIVSSIAASSDPFSASQKLRKLFDERLVYPLPVPQVLKGNEDKAAVVVQKAAELLEVLRGEKKPLIHHITNTVVMNDCANLTLSLGCSPIMSSSPEEAPSLSKFIGCLLLNLGTLTKAQIHAQEVAGIAANEGGKPVVFDPVGIGATQFRREMADGLLSAVHMTIIKGNAGEIGSLSNSTEVLSRGVDSVGSGFKDPVSIVRNLARREKVIVAMSGEVDYISDGEITFAVENGDKWQGEITGSGCMASTAVAAFASLADESGPLVAAVAGLLAINVSAELASSRSHVHGPNTFRSALIDEAFHLRGEDLRSRARVRVC